MRYILSSRAGSKKGTLPLEATGSQDSNLRQVTNPELVLKCHEAPAVV